MGADHPLVACDTLVCDDGTRFAVLVSHAPEPLTVKVTLDGGAPGVTLKALDGEPAGEAVALAPLGVVVAEIVSANGA